MFFAEQADKRMFLSNREDPTGESAIENEKNCELVKKLLETKATANSRDTRAGGVI